MKCGKMVKIGVMAEARPCTRKRGHAGNRHSPDLIGLTFGNLMVVKLGTPYQYRGGETKRWVTRNVANGVKKSYQVNDLISGNVKGLKHNFSTCRGKMQPEYRTVTAHYFKIVRYQERGYKGMPFCDDWNPDKSGAIWKGAKWIIENLGKKPGPEWSMDIVKHEIGFVPGNLRWARLNIQRRNQQHRTLGQFTDQEFLVEAKKRGFNLV